MNRLNPYGESSGSDPEATRITRVYRGYKLAGRASLYDLSNRGNRAIIEERLQRTRRTLEDARLADLRGKRVLDVGCGDGRQLARMREFGARCTDLVGVDLLPDRVEEAQRNHPDIEFRVANAVELDFPTASFDLLLSFTVFSSILDVASANRAADEMTRLLKPGGAILWYDLRVGNPQNRNVQGLTASQVKLLFPKLRPELRSITLAPPLARRLGPLTQVTYPLLAGLPFLRTHLLGVLAKPAN